MSVKQQIRKEIFEENNGKCQRCKCDLYLYKNGKDTRNKKKAHFHHIIHRSDGGTDTKENLLLTCWDCEKSFDHNNKNKPRIIKRREI